MSQEEIGISLTNKNKLSTKNFTSIIINGKDNKLESTTKKKNIPSKYYFESPVTISPLDNASNRANEIAKEMKNAEKNKKGSSVFDATFIRN
ncbi:hypothetical protein H8356DRAFT_1325640 [Neocallimastix lanati (nom. inval.)]|nr:hypothetical protein H8356DRAFT_1325640 [Neocallimastix sp. JGI-2020a]